MIGMKDLLASERGVFCIAVLLIASVLVFLGKLDGASWLDFAKYLTTALVASKTVTTAVDTYTTKKQQIPPADVVKE